MDVAQSAGKEQAGKKALVDFRSITEQDRL